MSTQRLLITRFSAAGDVAMCVPVVKAFAEKFSDVEIFFLSRKNFQPLFELMPKNVHFIGVDLKKYKGVFGLNRLYKEIKALKIDLYADFHDVLRTKYLRFRFWFSKVKVKKINKGRNDKKCLVEKGANNFNALKPTFMRYKDVLNDLGYSFEKDFSLFEEKKNPSWIGVAPFAAHKGKILSEKTMEEVVKGLSERNYKVFLFGFGDKERSITEDWQKKYSGVISLVGKPGGLSNELKIISQLGCMVSMDSANMHFASLFSTRVVSIWGATHPKAGFLGIGQSENDVVQVDLPCRPCSIYGNKECKIQEKYKCLNDISSEMILKKIIG